MSNLISRIQQPNPEATKTLILAHRTELLDQAQRQVQRFHPDWNVVIDQGKSKPDIEAADVVVASIQTLARKDSQRLDRYDPSLFKAIIIDEVHHAAAQTYQRVLDYFGTSDPVSRIFVWGCSATVRRHDGIGLYGIFDEIVYHKNLLQFIQDGWLCSLKVTTIETDVDLSHVATRYDDFSTPELSRAVNVETRNTIILESWKKYACNRKTTLVFAVDMSHSLELCNVFRSAGINAEYITSKTPMATRRDLISRYAAGDFPVLVNCGILTEGTDIPRIDCILMARPTRSSVLFQQMFGRGLRLYPTKTDCLMIDYVDNFARSGRRSLVNLPTLMGLDPKESLEDEDILLLEKRVEERERQAATMHQIAALDASCLKIKVTEYSGIDELIIQSPASPELRTVSLYNWLAIGDACILSVPKYGTITLARRKDKGAIWGGTVQYPVVRAGDHVRAYKPFMIPLEADSREAAIRATDTWLQRVVGQARLQLARRDAGYRKHEASAAQLKALKNRFKIEPQSTLTKGQAMDLLTRLNAGQLKHWRADHVAARKATKERQALAELKRSRPPLF
ncbi:P-loop containing nucleoside triphosphate hydrolase protein [Syncephalastrum racemosum]|uniref:P-loop containing nucleoside triphosphate hydrolase protein n=1 Tax=Syncephalastrum racemosum TaxID=13706 RepID=A0A1X2H1Y6_SYNRA|nr:P-loop containing nucleoside triphosphate hydrolase protein [Syncephalastrum racemosum]